MNEKELFPLFIERKESFISSLERSLSVIASDKFISQMFEDNLSSNFVPDRIIELIRQILKDDRENFIEKLMRRINSLETCFGIEYCKEFEEIGFKIRDLSSNEKLKETEQQRCTEILRDQIIKIQKRFNIQTIDAVKASKSIKNIKKSNDEMKDFFFQQSKKYLSLLRKAKTKSISDIQNMQNTIKVLMKENQKLKKEFNVSKKVVNEAIKEKEDLRKETDGSDTIEFIKKLKKEIEKKDGQIDGYKTMNEKLLIATQNLNKKTDFLRKENESVQQFSEDKAKELAMELTKLRNENENKTNLIDSLKEKQLIFKEKSEKIISDLKEENLILANKSETDITKLQKTIDKNEDTIQKLSDQILMLKNDISIKDSDCYQLKSDNKSYESKISFLSGELHKLKDDYSEVLSENQSLKSISAINTKQTTKTSELKKLLLERESTITKLNLENGSLRNYETENHNLSMKIEKNSKQIEEITKKNKELKNELEEKKINEEKFQKNILNLTKENENLLNLIKTKDSTIDALRAIKSTATGKMTQIESLTKTNNDLSNTLEIKQKEINQLKETNYELVSKLEEHKAEISQAISQLSKKAQKQKRSSSYQFNNPINDDSSTLDNDDEDEGYDSDRSDLSSKNKRKIAFLIKNNKLMKKALKQISRERKEAIENLISFRDQFYSEFSVKSEIDLLVKIKSLKESESLIIKICELLNIKEPTLIPSALKREKENKASILEILHTDNEDDIVSNVNSLVQVNKQSNGINNINCKKNPNDSFIINQILPILKATTIEEIPKKVNKLILKAAEKDVQFQQICKIMNLPDQSRIVTEIHSFILREKEEKEILDKISIIFSPQKSFNLNINSNINVLDYFSLIRQIKTSKDHSDAVNKLFSDLNCSNIPELQRKIVNLLNTETDFNRIQSIFSIFDNNDELIETIDEMKKNINQSIQILSMNNNEASNPSSLHNQNIEKFCRDKNLVASLQKLKIELIESQTKLQEKEESLSNLTQQMTLLESRFSEVSGLVESQIKNNNTNKTNIKSQSNEIISLRSSINEAGQTISKLQKEIMEKEGIINGLKENLSFQKNSIAKLQENLEEKEALIQNSENINKKSKLSITNNNDNSNIKTGVSNNAKENLKEISLDNKVLKNIGSLLNSTDPNCYTTEIENLKSEVANLHDQLNAVSLMISIKPTDSLQIKIEEIVNDFNLSNSIFDKLFRLLNVPSKGEVVPAISDIQKQISSFKQKERMLLSAANVNSDITLLSKVKEMRQTIEIIKNHFEIENLEEINVLGEILSSLSVKSLNEAKEMIEAMKYKSSICDQVSNEFANETKDLNEIPKFLKELKSLHSKSQINELCGVLKVKTITELKRTVEEMKEKESKINTLLKGYLKMNENPNNFSQNENNNDIVESISKLINSSNMICQILSISSCDKIEDETRKLKEKVTQFIKEKYQIKGLLKIKEDESISKQLDEQKEIEKRITEQMNDSRILQRLMKKLKLKSKERILPQVLEYKEISQNIIKLFLNNDIIKNKKLLKLQKHSKTTSGSFSSSSSSSSDSSFSSSSLNSIHSLSFDQIMKREDISTKIAQILKNEKKLCKMLNLEKPSEMKVIIKKMSETIDRLKSILNSEDVLSATQNLIEHNKVLFNQLNCSSFDEFKEKLGVIIKEKTEKDNFISELLMVLSISKNRNVDNRQKKKNNSNDNNRDLNKLLPIISELRKRKEESQLILNKALSLGFHGTNVFDASEFITSNEVKMENQKNLFENHKSLTELRQTVDKERKITETQKEKQKDIIQQLRKTISEIKESEVSINEKIINEKQKRKLIQNELERQKELNKSLNSLINSEGRVHPKH